MKDIYIFNPPLNQA